MEIRLRGVNAFRSASTVCTVSAVYICCMLCCWIVSQTVNTPDPKHSLLSLECAAWYKLPRCMHSTLQRGFVSAGKCRHYVSVCSVYVCFCLIFIFIKLLNAQRRVVATRQHVSHNWSVVYKFVQVCRPFTTPYRIHHSIFNIYTQILYIHIKWLSLQIYVQFCHFD